MGRARQSGREGRRPILDNETQSNLEIEDAEGSVAFGPVEFVSSRAEFSACTDLDGGSCARCARGGQAPGNGRRQAARFSRRFPSQGAYPDRSTDGRNRFRGGSNSTGARGRRGYRTCAESHRKQLRCPAVPTFPLRSGREPPAAAKPAVFLSWTDGRSSFLRWTARARVFRPGRGPLRRIRGVRMCAAYCRYMGGGPLDSSVRTTMSTRRFWARPSGVPLSATGLYSPYPAAESRVGS